MKKEIKKIVLAYSGGLDTSIIIPWLKDNYPGCEVIAVSGDVGQGKELTGLEEKAIKTGASKLYIEDLRREFIEDYIYPTMQAGAKYENTYLLGTSFARPVIAKRIVEIAKAEGADAIAHGCTGKGNDQVRFELTIKAFAPEMEIIAPWRMWDLKSRDEEIDYAIAKNVPIPVTRETNYSKDKNIWHLSHEGLDLEDPANEPIYDKILEMGVTPEKAPDEPTYLTISFERGVPVKLNSSSRLYKVRQRHQTWTVAAPLRKSNCAISATVLPVVTTSSTITIWRPCTGNSRRKAFFRLRLRSRALRKCWVAVARVRVTASLSHWQCNQRDNG